MKKAKISLLILTIVLIMIFIYIMYSGSPFPAKDALSGDYPQEYSIINENYQKFQGYNECAGFAAAYVLRHYGIEADGKTVYDQLRYKIPVSGYVWPKGVIRYLSDKNIGSSGMKGNIETLKRRLANGNPVISIIGEGFKWQHYVVLVGYSDIKNEMYMIDSNYMYDLNNDQPGNVTMSGNHFLSLWDNGLPIFNNYYIVIN